MGPTLQERWGSWRTFGKCHTNNEGHTHKFDRKDSPVLGTFRVASRCRNPGHIGPRGGKNPCLDWFRQGAHETGHPWPSGYGVPEFSDRACQPGYRKWGTSVRGAGPRPSGVWKEPRGAQLDLVGGGLQPQVASAVHPRAPTLTWRDKG